MMTSADELMGDFLLEERKLHKRYAELERALWAKFAVPGLFREDFATRQNEWNKHTALESCEVKDGKATAIARVRRHSHSIARGRYFLRELDGEWRIDGIGYFCMVCNGSGTWAQEQSCEICHGEGYFVSHEVNRVTSQSETGNEGSEGKHSGSEEIDNFMQEFIEAERELFGQFADLEQQFWTCFALPKAALRSHKHIHTDWQNAAQIESFKLARTHATVHATVVRAYQDLTCFRYSLLERDSTWWISDVEFECHLCCRRGKLIPQGEDSKEWTCPLCKGVGWFRPQTQPED